MFLSFCVLSPCFISLSQQSRNGNDCLRIQRLTSSSSNNSWDSKICLQLISPGGKGGAEHDRNYSENNSKLNIVHCARTGTSFSSSFFSPEPHTTKGKGRCVLVSDRLLDCFTMMMSWCLMSSDVIWHIRDKLWPMPKHCSIKSTYVRCMRV